MYILWAKSGDFEGHSISRHRLALKKRSHKYTYCGVSQVTLRVIQFIDIDLLLVPNICNSSL